MEGDAGASRLTPRDALDSSSTEVTAEDPPGSEVGADQTSTEVTAEDPPGSEVGADQTSTEVTAEETPTASSEVAAEDQHSRVDPASVSAEDARSESPTAEQVGTRLGRGWLIGITAALLVLACGLGAGGYLLLHFNQQSTVIKRNDAAAIQAAKECVEATQAPDPDAVAQSAQKIVECATGDFGAQAALYSSVLVEGYKAANVHVQVSEMRAAVESNNADGSVDVLVALRVKVSNVEINNQETGYRLRLKMAPEDGQYKIAKLDQVAK